MNETTNNKELLDYLLSEVEFLEEPTKKHKKQRKQERKGEIEKLENVTTVELPVFEKLHPLTKKLIRLGIIKLQNIEEVQRVEKEAKETKEPGEVHFRFFSHTEEIQQIKKVLEDIIKKAVSEGKEGVKIPYYVFRRYIEPEPTYKDLDRIAKEISEEMQGIRAEFEDCVFYAFVVSGKTPLGGAK